MKPDELLKALQRKPIEGYTPGPWLMWRDVHPDDPDKENVVILPEKAAIGHGSQYIAAGGGNVENNARLISITPDLQAENAVLREAVEEFARCLARDPLEPPLPTDDEIDRAKGLIAVAKIIVEAKETTDE